MLPAVDFLFIQMDIANKPSSQLILRLQQGLGLGWQLLCSPKTTGALLAILAVVLLLRVVLPQQTPPVSGTAAAAWVATLPTWIQPWGELLFFLGFSHIFQSLWLWLPLALLTLNSLVALAEYLPPSWQRARPAADIPAIEWQHPLAHRAEQSVRLPNSPDAFLDGLKEALIAKGFTIDPPAQAEQRIVSAARRRWAWLAVVTFYGGLLLLSAAFVVSHYTLKTERLRLFPAAAEESRLFGGSFELTQIDAANRRGAVTFAPNGAGQPPQTVRWRLYWPLVFKNAVMLPIALEPVLSIEAQDAAGEPRRLVPVQEDLAPATRLNLPLQQEDQPHYFLIPSASLSFQIAPVPGQNRYNVQVRRGSEASPSENLMVNTGEAFEVDGLLVTVGLTHDVTFVARSGGALLLFAVSLVVVAISGLLLYGRPPWQVWLMPEVKGRGGQLYGVAEKLGLARGTAAFLEGLLPHESGAGEEADSVE